MFIDGNCLNWKHLTLFRYNTPPMAVDFLRRLQSLQIQLVRLQNVVEQSWRENEWIFFLFNKIVQLQRFPTVVYWGTPLR